MSTSREKITYQCECHPYCSSKNIIMITENHGVTDIWYHYHIDDLSRKMESLGAFSYSDISALKTILVEGSNEEISIEDVKKSTHDYLKG